MQSFRSQCCLSAPYRGNFTALLIAAASHSLLLQAKGDYKTKRWLLLTAYREKRSKQETPRVKLTCWLSPQKSVRQPILGKSMVERLLLPRARSDNQTLQLEPVHSQIRSLWYQTREHPGSSLLSGEVRSTTGLCTASAGLPPVPELPPASVPC